MALGQYVQVNLETITALSGAINVPDIHQGASPSVLANLGAYDSNFIGIGYWPITNVDSSALTSGMIASGVDTFTLDAGTCTVTQVLGARQMNATELAAAQSQQVASLNSACAGAITAGFTSSALGSVNTYTLSTTDQFNLQAAYNAATYAKASATTWAANMAVEQYEVVSSGGNFYVAMTGGTTGATAPTFPTAFQTPVTDGTVTWALAGWLLGTAAGNQWHTAQQVIAVYQQYLDFVATCRGVYTALVKEVNTATTGAEVLTVIWSME